MAEDRPSIRTVAERAGVSTATVSNVLNLRRNVAPTLAERVHHAVAELGYIADLGAARLRSRRSTVVGVAVPDIANPFFSQLVAGLEELARPAGYDLLVVSSGGNAEAETARLRALLTWRPAGLIVVPSDDVLAARTMVRRAGVPMVIADRVPQNPDFDVVAVDNRLEASRVARHLLAGGHRRLLVVASDLGISNIAERVEGVREVARGQAEVEVIEGGLLLAGARERIATRLDSGPLPSAIFTLNNALTLGAVGALGERGLVPGEDLALAGFDDEEWMRVVAPSISAVHQPMEAIGQAAWQCLLARIGGDVSPPKELRLPCRFEHRNSTRAVSDSTAVRAA